LHHSKKGSERTFADSNLKVEHEEKKINSQPAPHSWFKQGKKKALYDESLFRAIHHTFFTRIWVGGALKLFSDTLKTTTPLVTKVLLAWLTESYIYVRTTDEEHLALGLQKPRGIGYGIGVAVGLFVMQGIHIGIFI